MADEPREPDPFSQESPSERRIDYLGREAFDRAVEESAWKATQRVASIHRHRLVVQSALVTFVVCATLGLGLALVFRHDAIVTTHTAARVNCELIAHLSGAMADFVSTDALLRAKQARLSVGAVGARFVHLFGRSLFVKALRESTALNNATVVHWRKVTVPKLVALQATKCKHSP